MTFSEFQKLASKIEKIKLPGEDSHFQMAPLSRRKSFDKTFVKSKNPKFAGVLVLFYPNEKGEAMLVLVLRKTYAGVHSGQISLPGGRKEAVDKSILDTALRETHEEIGLSSDKITILKSLTELYIPPSNYWVSPFLGIAHETPKFIPQALEVESIIEVKAADFLNDEFVVEENLSTSYAKNTKVPAFFLEQHVVWGATGMILNEVKSMVNQVMSSE